MAFTYFFRDQSTLDLIAEYAVPKLKTHRYIDVWDAGCANGSEPYSLAMMLRREMGDFMFRNVRIHATDLNGDFEEIVERGTYPDEQVKRIPRDIFERFFSPSEQPGHLEIDRTVRSAVRFQQHDLASLKPVRNELGLIVCKNVLMHLSESTRLDVIRMFRNCLSKDGFLAVEPTQKMPTEAQNWFKPVVTPGSLYECL